MKKLTYEEFGYFMSRVMWYYIDNISKGVNAWRMGQSIMNTLRNQHPELYIQISGTGADCFYNDNKIIHFIDAILEK